MPRPRAPGRLFLLLAVVLGTGGLGALATALPAAGAPGVVGGSPARPHSAGLPAGRAGNILRAGAPAGIAPALSAIPCVDLASRFSALYQGPELPPMIAPALAGACPLGRDEAGLGLLSPAPDGASRFSLSIALPTNSSPGRALSGFGVGLWLGGVSCSVDEAAYLTVDLVPPYGGVSASSDPDWSLWAPVWDLVPGGSCDPRCQNATALFTLAGSDRQFCEEDVLRSGIGTGSGTLGTFAPGAALSLTFLGSGIGSTGLSVYVNDTTTPADSLNWSYSAGSVVGGGILRPLVDASGRSAPGWADGPALSLLAYLCPTGPGNPACSSYDGPATAATAEPRLVAADAYNASGRAYDLPYPLVEPFSTSGACSGRPGTDPCQAFDAFGGTGAYPTWGLAASNGSASVTFGGAGPGAPAGLGGIAQYNATGGAGPVIAPESIVAVTNTSSAGALNVTARVASLAPIGTVTLEALGCFTSGAASWASTSLSEAPGPTNGSEDGNFTGGLPFSFASTGSVVFAVLARGPGGVPTPLAVGRAVHAGGGGTCTFAAPPAPDFTASDVSAIGDGYRVDLADNSSAVVGYLLNLTPSLGGASILRALTGPGPVNVIVGSAGRSYTLALTALDLAGNRSTAATVSSLPPTLSVLSASLTVTNASSYWNDGTTGWFNASFSGGVGPYRILLGFGDGASVNLTTAAGSENVSHKFASYAGVALATLSVTDASGEGANATPVGITVLPGALGTTQSLQAGGSDVGLYWSPPAPSGEITGYTVFWTENATEAPFVTQAWPDNETAAGIFIWNTTLLSFDVTNLLPNTSVFMIVVGWADGQTGLTPGGWFQVPGATTATMVAGPILATPVGGPAPLNVSLSDEVTTGINATIDESIYAAFPILPPVSANATVTTNGTVSWLNASLTLNYSGTYTIVLHIGDAHDDEVIPVTTVYVAAAAPPNVSAAVGSGVALVGEPVLLEGSATGGLGNLSFAWEFGDGSNGSGVFVNHTYVVPGNYSVLLTVTDEGTGVTATTVLPLTVFALPIVSIRATATDTTGASYNFTAEASGGVGNLTYAWAFGDGATASGRWADHRYNTPGTYSVNVTVTDADRHEATSEITLVVPAPAAPASSALSPLIEAALVGLGVIALLGVVGTAYFYGRSHPEPGEEEEPPEDLYGGPPPALGDEPESAPEALPEATEPVHALPPPDPPDPS